jgi:ribosome-associated protein
MKTDLQTVLNLIAQTIYDKKGLNILSLDVRGVSSLTDTVVIAEGLVDKHVQAIAQSIIESVAATDLRPLHTEGLQSGDWIVIDYLDIMVHLFMPGMRDKYQLESLWKEGQIIDTDINISPIKSIS